MSCSFSHCRKAGRQWRLFTSYISNDPSLTAWGAISGRFFCTFGPHLYYSGRNHKTRLRSELSRDTAVARRVNSKKFSCFVLLKYTFSEDTDGTVLFCILCQVLVTVTMSLLLSTCLEAQHPFKGILLSQRDSVHCHDWLCISRVDKLIDISCHHSAYRRRAEIFGSLMSDEKFERTQLTDVPRMRG